jgi:hypothetical protein
MKRILAAILAFFMGSSCKPAPPPPRKIVAPVFVCVGGLNKSQMPVVAEAVQKAIPSMVAINMGAVDAYKVDTADWILRNTSGDVWLAGHSYGAHAVAKVAAKLIAAGRVVRMLILLDAVAIEGDTITVPAGVPCVHYKAQYPTPFIWRASLSGQYLKRTVGRFHNDVPEAAAPEIVALVWGVM